MLYKFVSLADCFTSCGKGVNIFRRFASNRSEGIVSTSSVEEDPVTTDYYDPRLRQHTSYILA